MRKSLKELTCEEFWKEVEEELSHAKSMGYEGIGYSRQGGYFYLSDRATVPPDAVDQYFFWEGNNNE